MNAPCKYDDRLLDYLYEEMSGKDAAEFSAHVQGCTLCQKNLAGFRRVRSAMSEAATPEVRSEEALARLTAQVLQQVAKPSGAMGTRTLGSTQNLPSAEMGKVLPLRQRGRLASVLFHPASPIVAMAAAALVFVMWKQQQGGPLVQPERLEPPATLSPAPGAPPTESAPVAAPAPKTPPLAAAEQDPDKGRDPLARGPMKPAGAQVAKPAIPMDTAPASEESEKKVLLKPRERAEARPADDLDELDRSVGAGRKAEARDPSASAAPAAEPRAPVSSGSVQEPAGRFAQPPPPPPAQQAPRRDVMPSPAQADRGASELQEGAETMKQAVQRSQRAALEGALSGNKDKNQDEAAVLLKQLREHLREGRCREASETLNQLEQKFHGTEVPVEDRLALQRCGQQEFEAPAQMQETASRRRAVPPPAKAAKAKAAPPQRGKADKTSVY